MKRAITTVMLTLLLITAGCGKKGNKAGVEPAEDMSSASVKEYVENNTFIDVDVNELVNALINPDAHSSVKEADMAKMKAAVYRFYSNVKIKDGYYVCDVPDGVAINISDAVFNALKENLDEMNNALKEAKENGHEVKISEPDSVYLNSLLQ
ncbi:MAG: hypothetical protein K2M11_10085 [Paramuribaculum sp.]|nr:hypothetical protein [Paramuribaculum sp.]